MATADQAAKGEEREAWRSYQAATRGLPVSRYEEVEPWAWNRLQVRLRASKARLKARSVPAKTVGTKSGS